MGNSWIRGTGAGLAVAPLAAMASTAEAQSLPPTTGGPDAGGYTWIDSRAAGGPEFGFIDISDDASVVENASAEPLGTNEVSVAIPLGFDFEFYGETYNEVFASSNGFLTFLADSDNGCCIGQAIPTPDGWLTPQTGIPGPDGLIAYWWTGLEGPGSEGPRGAEMNYATFGAAGDRVFVFEALSLAPQSPELVGAIVSAQVHLREADNTIEIHYELADIPPIQTEGQFQQTFYGAGSPVTVGIESATGLEGLEYFHDFAPDFPQGLAVRFVPGDIEDCDGDGVPLFQRERSRLFWGLGFDGLIVTNDRGTKVVPPFQLPNPDFPPPVAVGSPVGLPYGLEFDSQGRLWAAASDFGGEGQGGDDFGAYLVLVDPETRLVTEIRGLITTDPSDPFASVFVFDMAIQPGTDRIFVTAVEYDAVGVDIYELDPDTGLATRWIRTPLEEGGGGLSFDAAGRLFLTDFTQNPVFHELTPPPPGFTPPTPPLSPDLSVIVRSVNPWNDSTAGVEVFSLGFDPARGVLVGPGLQFFTTAGWWLYEFDPDTLEPGFSGVDVVHAPVLNTFVSAVAFQPAAPFDCDDDPEPPPPGDCFLQAGATAKSVAAFDGSLIEDLSPPEADDDGRDPDNGVDEGDATRDRIAEEPVEPSGPRVARFADNTASVARVGDNQTNEQLMAILHFDTPDLSLAAAIDDLSLRFTLMQISGNPAGLGDLVADLKLGAFNDDPALEKEDFEAPADFPAAARVPAQELLGIARGQSIRMVFDREARAAAMQSETIQIRLRFEEPTNSNGRMDAIVLATGNFGEFHPYTADLRFVYTPFDCEECLPAIARTDGDAPARMSTATVASIGALDGDIREDIPGAGIGFYALTGSQAMAVGDNANGAQFMGMLAFDTSMIPANAAVIDAEIRMVVNSRRGDPESLGALVADLTCPLFGPFGSSEALEPEDFQHIASFPAAALLDASTPRGAEVVAPIDFLALGGINRGGVTNIRIRFEEPTNGNPFSDQITFWTGSAHNASVRPTLRVTWIGGARAERDEAIDLEGWSGDDTPSGAIEAIVGQRVRIVPLDDLGHDFQVPSQPPRR